MVFAIEKVDGMSNHHRNELSNSSWSAFDRFMIFCAVDVCVCVCVLVPTTELLFGLSVFPWAFRCVVSMRFEEPLPKSLYSTLSDIPRILQC